MGESSTECRRKRIVEHVIEGFTNAQSAIIFGNTVDRLVKDKIGKQKYRQQIGALDVKIAITDKWTGPTVLKTSFLALDGDEMAQFICAQFSKSLKIHNDVHRASLRIVDKVIRIKPQPQYIG